MSIAPYFSDETVDGKFTLSLFEDPNNPPDLKLEVRLNHSGGLTRTSGDIALRAELTEDLADRLADALQRWYASPFETEEIEMNGFGT
jgi:hypothetical protein